MRTIQILILFACLAGMHPASARGGPANVVETVHNLSATGPGEIRAAEETGVCVFCHVAHTSKGNPKLFSRGLPTGTFEQPRRNARGQRFTEAAEVYGPSRMCLSCHDGTLALGHVVGRAEPIPMRGTAAGRMPKSSRGYLGRDLTGSHPIGVSVARAAAENGRGLSLAPIEKMRADPELRLGEGDTIHCTTCHDPHSDVNYESSGVHFYAKPSYSDTCLACHEME